MADIYLLTGLTLPPGVAHESLPGIVALFVSDCRPGMGRTQMMDRAKRRSLHLSFRATARAVAAKRKELFTRAARKETALYVRSAIMPILSEVAPYDFRP